MKKVIDRGKRSKTLSQVKLVENISKNLQSFPCKRKSFFNINCKTMHDYQNPFGLKEDNFSQINCQNQLSLIQGKICDQQNSNKGLKYW